MIVAKKTPPKKTSWICPWQEFGVFLEKTETFFLKKLKKIFVEGVVLTPHFVNFIVNKPDHC